jgi:nucleotide-binding universal stress UspA family protein
MRWRKVIAAVDETPAGVHALRAAAQVANAAGAELVALRIVSDPWTYVRPEEVEPLRAHFGRAPADLAEERCLADLRQVIGNVSEAQRAQPVIRFGIPSLELARWASLEGADLLVLGRQPLGTFERRPADRTIARTLREAAVPCLIVPFGQRTWHTVVAVLDASDRLDTVDATAAAFAAVWGGVPRRIRREPANAHRSLVYAVHGDAAPDPEPVPSADPLGESLKLAREARADVIVVGYRDCEGLGGSMTRWLQRAPCAVLAVPLEQRDVHVAPQESEEEL